MQDRGIRRAQSTRAQDRKDRNERQIIRAANRRIDTRFDNGERAFGHPVEPRHIAIERQISEA